LCIDYQSILLLLNNVGNSASIITAQILSIATVCCCCTSYSESIWQTKILSRMAQENYSCSTAQSDRDSYLPGPFSLCIVFTHAILIRVKSLLQLVNVICVNKNPATVRPCNAGVSRTRQPKRPASKDSFSAKPCLLL